MAEIDRAVMDRLAQGGTIAQTRVNPEFNRQNQQYPALVVARVSGPTELLLDGPTGVEEGRWQIDCWAASYAQAIALAGEVNALLDGFTGLIGDSPQVLVQMSFKENETDLSNVDGDRTNRRRSLDYVIRYEV